MKILLILPMLMLAACSTTRAIHLPDGWVAFEINCSGPLSSFDACLEKAGENCPRGYDVLDEKGGVIPDNPRSLSGGGLGNISLQSESRKLLVKCH